MQRNQSPRYQTDRGEIMYPHQWHWQLRQTLFMDHIVKAVAAGMTAGASNTTPGLRGVVTIVQWETFMRERVV